MVHTPIEHVKNVRSRVSFQIIRFIWPLFAVGNFILLVAAVPAYYAQIRTVCHSPVNEGCSFAQLNEASLSLLDKIGITFSAYVHYTVILHTLASTLYFVLGVLLFRSKFRGWYTLSASFFLIAFGTMGVSMVLFAALRWAYPEITWFLDAYPFVFPLLGLFLVTFPDGKFVPKWGIAVVPLWLFQFIFFEALINFSIVLLILELIITWGSTLAVQWVRYFKEKDAVRRQQTKWLVFGFSISITILLLQLVLVVALPDDQDAVFMLTSGTALTLLYTPIALGIGISLLRFRLWEIDPIINRTLVYALLTLFVIGSYIVLISYISSVLQIHGGFTSSLIATGVVAVLFAPVRQRLQLGVNRLIYGDRDDPNALLARFGRRLEETMHPTEVMPAIVELTAQSLKLPYAAIRLKKDKGMSHTISTEPGEWEVAASYGRFPSDSSTLLELPLNAQGVIIGKLQLAPRDESSPFSVADRRLLEDLAGQAGIAVLAVRQTTNALQLARDLHRSREQLVLTREEERRRLRRDLHDGLGPTLAGLTLKVDAVREEIPDDPQTATSMLISLKHDLQGAVAEIRQLVYELRPPTLDELGLTAAMRILISKYESASLRITFNASDDLPELSAAVEVAIYRITAESLTNIVTHAQATEASVLLEVDDQIKLEIHDNGVGVPEGKPLGVGIISIRERAYELGGTCIIESGINAGTHVRVLFPISD
ncbi:GAF domain-containing sensor histidine kinase [Lederbergia citri]|uniref:histidine kinase n=1 Tax=Lederbergia citri TaxID=2833580 RepID=A0A942TKF0_9BACI|nr:histidine kinase [Lederbergia citri]MBS4197919.1 sensor histidine kinase [Lederbergia citri]